MAKSKRAIPSAKSSGSQPYCPEAGDVIFLDFDPQAGREQSGRRPAVVLTGRRYNALVGLCVLCPITNQAKGYPFEVAIPAGHAVKGVILSDQVKSLSWVNRKAAFLCAAPASAVAETKAKIKALLAVG